MPQTPSSSSDILSNEFNKLGWYKNIGILGNEPYVTTAGEISEALKRAGGIVQRRYGDQVFQGQLGPKIAQDLKNLMVGAEFRVVEKDFLIVITGLENGYRVEVGFAGEQAKVASVEGKTRLSESFGLKFLKAGD
jgi:hypothetical protein